MRNNNFKKNLTFVDIDFHKKTKSGNFLYQLFSKYFKTNLIWVRSHKNKFDFDTSNNNLKHNIFFFQYLPDFLSLYKLKKKKIFWAPMYDDIKRKNYFFWYILSFFNVKVISFSRKINEQCENHNINFIYLKYFPKVKKIKRKKKFSIFFWYRGTVKISDWIYSIDKNKVKEIIYFNLKDPNFVNEKINKKLKKNYNIKFFQGGYGKKDHIYKKLITRSDIYIAPREREGIGHSFLEAMSEGKYIVSKNEETMNEYISSKKIGSFFGEKINLENVFDNQKARIRLIKKLNQNWEKNKIKIVTFIKEI